MTPDLEKAQQILVKYAQLYAATYKQRWMPSNEQISETLQLLKSPLPGFQPYTTEDLIARLEVFFKAKDQWLVSCCHNLSVFVKHVHRFIPANAIVQSRVSFRQRKVLCDCGNELTSDEICAKCFPICSKCGERHTTQETCEELAERNATIRTILDHGDRRAGSAKQIGELL